jgi:hypothetical protein
MAMVKPNAEIALFENRPFFEKALRYGIQHGLIDSAKLQAIRTEAPKGMVQIARYFGTEYLRPELETARLRMVNLVSLYLERSSAADLHHAALQLRENSLLSRSKGGSDMLKAMLALPENTHFGMHEGRGFREEEKELKVDQKSKFRDWTLKSLDEFNAELSKRQPVAQVMDAAIWFAQEWGIDVDTLEGADAEAVIRTALIMGSGSGKQDAPDWVRFQKRIEALRKKSSATKLPAFALPSDFPQELIPAALAMVDSVRKDWPKMMDVSVSVEELFKDNPAIDTPAFFGRYFWLEDGLAQVEDFERKVSAAWDKATGGHDDEDSLLTLFLGLAAGATPKTLLSEKSAGTLIRKIRKSGFKPELATQFIQTHAPAQFQADYTQMWESFVEEGRATLESDADYALHDALALLRRECNVTKT